MNRTNETSDNTPNSWGDTEEMRDRGCINELILVRMSTRNVSVSLELHTGTFFCVMTTEVSVPLTEIAVCPEPEIALNAYSAYLRQTRLSSSTSTTYQLDTADPPGRKQ